MTSIPSCGLAGSSCRASRARSMDRCSTYSDVRCLGGQAYTPAMPIADAGRQPAGPRILAHRGASGHATENSLAAFRLAAELGADGVELDVHATRDGAILVHHDPDLPG